MQSSENLTGGRVVQLEDPIPSSLTGDLNSLMAVGWRPQFLLILNVFITQQLGFPQSEWIKREQGGNYSVFYHLERLRPGDQGHSVLWWLLWIHSQPLHSNLSSIARPHITLRKKKKKKSKRKSTRFSEATVINLPSWLCDNNFLALHLSLLVIYFSNSTVLFCFVLLFLAYP